MQEPQPERGLRILLVEDCAEVREALELLLRMEGAEVQVADAAGSALEIAGRHDFDVIVTDLGLPDVPGDVLIREILATATPRPRVIAITGFTEPYRARARAAGADAVLTKPFDWSALRAELTASPGAVASADGATGRAA